MPTIWRNSSSAAGIWLSRNSINDNALCMGRRVRGFSAMVNYRLTPDRIASNSPGVFGQSFLSSIESERSASSLPPVWQPGQ